MDHEKLIEFIKKFEKNANWELSQQNPDRYGERIVSAPILDEATAEKVGQDLKARLGEDVIVQVRLSPDSNHWRVFVDQKTLEHEIAQREKKLQTFHKELESKREGLTARIHPIFARGGKAEGLLVREQYMLSQEQANFVRQKQLEAAFNSQRSRSVRHQLTKDEFKPSKLHGSTEKATGMILSHETHPSVFSKDDPHILIGDNGEVIMLSSRAAFDKGGKGMVYIGQRLDTGDFCVVKSPLRITTEERIEFESENTQLEDLNLLIEKMDVMHQGQAKLFSVQELAWGQNYCKRLDIETGGQNNHDFLYRMDMFIEALKCFDQLHNVDRKLHKDIKVENIMWDDQTRRAQLVDMGATKDRGPDGTVKDKFFGTPAYMAPELVRAYNRGAQLCEYNMQTEAYAIGVLGCEMFSADNLSLAFNELLENIQGRDNGLSAVMETADIFQFDPNRSLARQALFDLLRKMVDLDPKERPSLSEVMKMCLEIRKDLEAEQKAYSEPLPTPSSLPPPPSLTSLPPYPDLSSLPPVSSLPPLPPPPSQTQPPLSQTQAQSILSLPEELKTLRDSLASLIKAKQRSSSSTQHKMLSFSTSGYDKNQELTKLQKTVEQICTKDTVSVQDLERLSQSLIDARLNFQLMTTTSTPQQGVETILRQANEVIQKIVEQTAEYQAAYKGEVQRVPSLKA